MSARTADWMPNRPDGARDGLAEKVATALSDVAVFGLPSAFAEDDDRRSVVA